MERVSYRIPNIFFVYNFSHSRKYYEKRKIFFSIHRRNDLFPLSATLCTINTICTIDICSLFPCYLLVLLNVFSTQFVLAKKAANYPNSNCFVDYTHISHGECKPLNQQKIWHPRATKPETD